jgi:hypothetical protein
MSEILVEVRAKAARGDLSGKPAMPESFMKRVDEVGQSLQEIADRLSEHLDRLEKREAPWRLERVELKFSLDLEAEAGVIIARTKTSAGFEASLGWKSTSA